MTTPSTQLVEAVRLARESGDFSLLIAAVPYSQFMGFSVAIENGELIAKMAYSPHLVGNANIPALHGGTVGALLESAAIYELIWRDETTRVPKIINLTVQYLRSAKALDTYARCAISRQGRRVANVRAWAWQDDPEKCVASANAHFLVG